MKDTECSLKKVHEGYGTGVGRVLRVSMAVTLGLVVGCASSRAGRGGLPAACDAATVLVAYRLRAGEPGEPNLQISGERCPNCGGYHGDSLDMYAKTQRSHFAPGYFVAPEWVVTEDLFLPAAQIAGVTVGDRPATIERRFPDRKAMLLRVAGAPHAPLKMAAGKPAYAASANPQAMIRNRLLAPARAEPPSGAPARLVPGAVVASPALLLDARLRPVGFSFDGSGEPFVPQDAVSVAPDADLAAPAVAAAARFIVPVTLAFRSPKKARAGDDDFSRYVRYRFRASDEADNDATVRHTFAFRATSSRLLVYAPPSCLARLETITAYLSPSNAVRATFAHAYRQVELFAADLPAAQASPLPAIVPGAAARRAAVAVVVAPEGRGRLDIHALPVFLTAPTPAWRDYPVQEAIGASLVSHDRASESGVFIFPLGDPAAAPLYAPAPVIRPANAIGGGGYDSDDCETLLIPAAMLAAFAHAPASEVNPALKPLPSDKEDVSGWLGMDLHPLTRELAEARSMLGATDGGRFGAIVASVAKGSPAAVAGIQSGWVLHTLTPEGSVCPLSVWLEENDSGGEERFPWDQLDEIPPQYFSRLPTPWPPAVTPFNAALGALGVGSTVTARFLLPDGSRRSNVLAIAEAPLSYVNAPAQVWKGAGVTLCALTQDVRDYLGLGPDAPGLVVCAVEPGGAAVTAGLRPYELVTHINGTPLRSTEELAALTARAGAYRLNVTRMTASRVVSFTSRDPTKE